jgi:hypothetical protein
VQYSFLYCIIVRIFNVYNILVNFFRYINAQKLRYRTNLISYGGKMITVFVKIRSHYGVDRIYPNCPVSEIFSKMTKTKTLSPEDLSNIQKLGYVIKAIRV